MYVITYYSAFGRHYRMLSMPASSFELTVALVYSVDICINITRIAFRFLTSKKLEYILEAEVVA